MKIDSINDVYPSLSQHPDTIVLASEFEMSHGEGFVKISSLQMNSQYFKFLFALIALAECRIFHVNNISEMDLRSNAATSIGQQQAWSVVHCTLICMNTNGCWSSIFKGNRCFLLRERRHRQSQHMADNGGAVVTQLDVSFLHLLYLPNNYLSVSRHMNQNLLRN